MPARIAAQPLLHRFVLNADSFLPDLRTVVYSAFSRLRFPNRRRNRLCTSRRTSDSPTAVLIFSYSVQLGAKNARDACVFTQPRIHEISTGEIMKYLFLIAAI